MERSKKARENIKFLDDEKREKLRAALQSLLAGAVGLLLSRAKIFGNPSPLGLAFSAAVPQPMGLAASVGALLGYLLTFSGTSGVRYMACVAGVALITFTVTHFKDARQAKLIAPFAAALCCASTGLAVLLAEGFSLNGTVSFAADCLLSGGMTYFFSQSIDVLVRKAELRSIGRRGTICIVISCCALLTSLADITVMNFSPARMAAAFAVMIMCFTLREAGGAFSGICSGVTLSAACSYPTLGAVFSAAGLCGGLFYPFGQLGISAAFICVCGINAVISPSPQSIAVIAESAAAALIFVLIPRSKLEKLRVKLTPEREVSPDARRDGVCKKLEDAGEALKEVGSCIEQVSGVLDASRADDPAMIKARVKQGVCTDCPQRAVCCNEKERLRERTFSNAVMLLREKNYLSEEDLDAEFISMCPRSFLISENFDRVFTDSIAEVRVSEKTRQLRRAVAENFGAMADILSELGSAAERTNMLLPSQSDAAKDALISEGFEPLSVECVRRADGRIYLNALVSSIEDGTPLRPVTESLSRCLGVRLTLPAIKDTKDGVTLRFLEKEQYCFELGAVQHPSGGDSTCGDCYDCFSLDDGHSAIILSDGMGTGKRAAVDSAMAADLLCTLMRSGFSIEAALKAVNTALIAKCDDESLATLDAALLDPYSGCIRFFKAGAAPCFVRRGGKTAMLEMSSLPAGILSRISFSQAEVSLSEGDLVIMLSDGVIPDGGEWLHSVIRSWRGDAQGLAEQIAASALSRQKGKRSDDMTVICARLCRVE